MKKTILSLSILFCLLANGIISPVSAADSTTSKYAAKIDACMKARKETKAKSIQDHICPEGDFGANERQEVAYQVIMSLEFKELDNKIKTLLTEIHAGAGKDITILTQKIRTIDNDYKPQYKEICDNVVMQQTMFYMHEINSSISTDGKTPEFISWQNKCSAFIDKKLKAYKESAWLLGEAALIKAFQADKSTYTRKLKDQYQKFLGKWMTYIGQLSVINDKWLTTTK